MFLPIAAETGDRRTPGMTLAIVAVTSMVSLLLMSAVHEYPFGDSRALELLLLTRADTAPTSLVGHALIHGSLWHLVGNMLVLFVLGSALEPRIGHWRFLALYVVGALCGGLAFLLAGEARGALGASGAVMAVAGAFLVFLPFQRVVMIFPLVLFLAAGLVLFFDLWIGLLLTVPIYWAIAVIGAADAEEGILLRLLGFRAFGLPGLLLVGIWIGLDAWAMFSATRDGVGHSAHLGGALLGVVVAIALLLARVVAPLDRTVLHLLGWKAPLAEHARPEVRGPAAAAFFARRTTPRATRRPEMSFSDFARRRAAGEPV